MSKRKATARTERVCEQEERILRELGRKDKIKRGDIGTGCKVCPDFTTCADGQRGVKRDGVRAVCYEIQKYAFRHGMTAETVLARWNNGRAAA